MATKVFFLRTPKVKTCENVLSAFLPQYYLGKNTPKQILLSHKLDDKILISKALSTKIIHSPRVVKKILFRNCITERERELKAVFVVKFY